MTTCSKTQKHLPEKYKVLADSIRVGKENAILLDDLMIIAGIEDKRSAYQIIEDLIVKHGYVIAGSKQGQHKGYYVPQNEAEFNEVIHTFKTTINSMQKRHDSLHRNFKNKGATAQ